MEKKERKIRVLLGKPGLCGHDRGILILAMALRDAGMEVIYSGRHNSPEQIVGAAIQEDVDILGVSILSGAHLSLCRRIGDLLCEKKAQDICFVVGGFIPDEDVPELKTMGVQEVFGVTSSIKDITGYFSQVAKNRRSKD
ncbi:MAG: cobalamin B12-binding domain-containing protein [Deltaproteobacteria bacterium]|nr:cobalamin B12-binding domain-containing protein [Deltaproteobacteria bacterium]